MALDYFAGQSALELGLFWFELKLMKIMGFAPQLKECLICHHPVQEDNAFPEEHGARAAHRGKASETRVASVFSCVRGGVLCTACAPSAPIPTSSSRDEAGVPITPDILGLLRFWQSSRSWRSAQSAACTPRQTQKLERILGLFMQYHLEIDNPARAVALSILRTRITL